ncbi:MAG TPA: type II secretion system protein [Humidesulfovibrio sp.]|uniref:PilW family protein n=1 Tax=Humidesulfovibrio sp. TaxID=2910988 RepID=UPI002CEC95BC|nr:type II secretion system protein [Humidesulfovibrio sp.]HWR02516.1 type II secretion system protein [Humidesulfovibrio sp.]
MRRQAGFTLIELIAVVIILGLIGGLMGFFISTGARGNLAAMQAEQNAQRGQIALQRISLELRDMNGGPTGSASAPLVASSPPSIRYTSSQAALSDARTLAYSAGTKTITIIPTDGGTPRTLVDGVESCTMTTSGTSATYDITFTVTFTLTGTSAPFSITVKPRNTIITPVTS